jgi:hypothetical protein
MLLQCSGLLKLVSRTEPTQNQLHRLCQISIPSNWSQSPQSACIIDIILEIFWVKIPDTHPTKRLPLSPRSITIYSGSPQYDYAKALSHDVSSGGFLVTAYQRASCLNEPTDVELCFRASFTT